MKFEVPKITRSIRMAEYAPEFGAAEIVVWVNPPVKILQEHDGVVKAIGELLLLPGRDLTTEDTEEKREALKENFKRELEELADRLARMFSELWSQGGEGTRWSMEEIRELVSETAESDPQLWPWLRERTIGLIREHRNGIKKN